MLWLYSQFTFIYMSFTNLWINEKWPLLVDICRQIVDKISKKKKKLHAWHEKDTFWFLSMKNNTWWVKTHKNECTFFTTLQCKPAYLWLWTIFLPSVIIPNQTLGYWKIYKCNTLCKVYTTVLKYTNLWMYWLCILAYDHQNFNILLQIKG